MKDIYIGGHKLTYCLCQCSEIKFCLEVSRCDVRSSLVAGFPDSEAVSAGGSQWAEEPAAQ